MPVLVPAPGEYVARDAAIQAAWALEGTRPDWELELETAPPPDHHPMIREQYGKIFRLPGRSLNDGTTERQRTPVVFYGRDGHDRNRRRLCQKSLKNKV